MRGREIHRSATMDESADPVWPCEQWQVELPEALAEMVMTLEAWSFDRTGEVGDQFLGQVRSLGW